MPKYCPLIKEKCKEGDCAFWEESCQVFSFMQAIESKFANEDEDLEEAVIPEEIMKASEDKLAEELYLYVKKANASGKCRDDEYGLFDKFWQSKGIDTALDAPDDAHFKMESVGEIVSARLEKERFKEEKAKLPQLAEACAKWAKENGLKRITKSDLNAFEIENSVNVVQDIRTLIYSKANALLKDMQAK